MSELQRHGTGWSETEVLMDVVEVYNSWDGDGTPNFTPVQRRLAEKFEDNELIALETVVDTLAQFIAAELYRRQVEKERSASQNEVQG